MISERMPLSGNLAVAYAVKACNVDVFALYPITPQVEISEQFGQFLANGETDAQFIPVESEHSAISASIGASATGARSFTATASQGLALMHECLPIASACRLPIVMAVANRALSAPINIHCDHTDTMSSRDCGWVQIFASSAQEAYDSVIQSYKLAERDEISLPVMVCYDGYIISHTYEAVLINKEEDIIAFAPKNVKRILDPDNPTTVGIFTMPDYHYEFRYQVVDALNKVPNSLTNIDKEFKETFGRGYGLYETYKIEDAEVVMVAMGSIACTAKVVVDELQKNGKKVGLFRPRLFRPNPTEEWRKILSNAEVLMVVDRSMAAGSTLSPLMLDINGAFMNEKSRPLFKNFTAGIGGRDVTTLDIKNMFLKTIEAYKNDNIGNSCEYYGVR